MNPDLDKLKTQLPAELESLGFVVFHGLSRADEESGAVLWDTVQRPDYQDFLQCASKLSVKILVFNTRELEKQNLADVQDELDALDMAPSERRDLDRRLKALHPYTGFTSNLELSFDYNGTIYLYEIRSEFMNEFLAIMNEVDSGLFPPSTFEDDDPDSTPGGGGYFSRN
ncbi:MAG TPA: hypothetical protein VFQ91_25530 [Bryobacteraceae bacterium]|nr:hypothetical protein [Bryobacteraceae bacterium]